MSSMMILAASVFEISCEKNRQTHTQTIEGKNPTTRLPSPVGVGN